MHALSIYLPDQLAKESQKVANRLGISRAQFIRNAVAHEIALVRSQEEEDAIIQCFMHMKNDPDYLAQIEEWS